MHPNTKVLEKIRRLLALSKSSNEHEAALAAAKAQELLFKHNLCEYDIADERIRAEDVERQFLSLGNTAAWRSRLIHQIAKYNFGKTIVLRDGQIALIAEPSNAEIIIYIYQYAKREIERLADERWKVEGVGSARAWKNSFRLGAVDAVGQALARMRKSNEGDAKENTRAVVLAKDTAVMERFRELYPHTQKIKTRTSGHGYSNGYRAGQSITINQGVRGRKSNVAGYLK